MKAWRWISIVLFVGIFLWMIPGQAHGATIELSGGLSFNRSNYTNSNFSWTRRWGASFGYHFTDTSGIEFSFQDVVERTKIGGYEDTTFHDKIYSVNWVQSLLGKKYPVQPYVKGGVGQLNRDATGTYMGGAAPASHVDSVTGVLGAGLRLYLMRQFAIRSEVTSYLSGGRIATWKDNIGFTMGISYYF